MVIKKMTSNDVFWRNYDVCSQELATARTVDDVLRICNSHFDKSSGDAFFPGGSGDTEVLEVLIESGWHPVWVQAWYYWGILQPDRKEGLHYVEGDIYRGVGKPLS